MRQRLLLVGPPGAGKGTQAKEISERTSLVHLSTGDILRDETASGSKLGKDIARLIDAGSFVPDEMILQMIKRPIERCRRSGFILDGYPRNLKQAKELESITAIDRVILLDVERTVVLKRLFSRRVCANCGRIYSNLLMELTEVCPSCGGLLVQREDDKDKNVNQRRYDTYVSLTEPIIGYYRSQELLSVVNGSQLPEEVLADILDIINQDDPCMN